MIVFLPISRYRVEYQVASGRPFSSFERLLLRAVDEGSDSVEHLSRVFGVHNRLIVEGLVTLMQAGWVSLNSSDDKFVVTASGKRAQEQSVLPPTLAVRQRHSTIVMEKVAGQVARNDEVNFVQGRRLGDGLASGLILRPGNVSNVVDSAMIAPLLAHESTEWVRWIGPINVLSDNAVYAVMDVDTERERIQGVPASWETQLLLESLEKVRAKERAIAEAGIEVDEREMRKLLRLEARADEQLTDEGESERHWLPIDNAEARVLQATSDHRFALESLIVEAETSLAFALPALPPTFASDLGPLLAEAVERGVVVSLFVGTYPSKQDEAHNVYEMLKKLEYDSARNLRGGRLQLGTMATECGTSIILADAGNGTRSILGNHHWAKLNEEGRGAFSLLLSSPWVIARLCDILAGFAAADEKLRLGAGLVWLKKEAGVQRRNLQGANGLTGPIAGPSQAQGRLLLEKEHLSTMASLASAARSSLRLVTDDLPGLARTGWLGLMARALVRDGRSVTIDYDGVLPSGGRDDEALEQLLKNGASVERRLVPHGTLVIADETTVLMASETPRVVSARQHYAARVGIMIKNSVAIVENFVGSF